MYQDLYGGKIFIGGASDAEGIVNKEHCDVIVDFRAETEEFAVHNPAVHCVRVPLSDNVEGQESLIEQAVHEIIGAYQEGKKSVFIVPEEEAEQAAWQPRFYWL